MDRAEDLLRSGPVVVNIGLEQFADELAAAGVPVVHLLWNPSPTPRHRLLAARLADDPEAASGLGALIARANEEALKRIVHAEPVLTDVRPAREVVPAIGGRTLLHAGPPIAFENMCGPMRGAIIGALLYEGWAETPAEAERVARSGAVEFAPCHDRQAVGPMAGVISPSMPVLVVENRTAGTVAFAPLNEGWGRTLRFGAFDSRAIARLRWMERTLGPTLAVAIRALGGINVKTLTAQALHMGDECHNRDIAGTSLFFKLVAPTIATLDRPREDVASVLRFLADHEHFFLNISMAACKATLMAAEGVAFSTVVTAIARNGVEVGIQVSGLGGRWFTAPAPFPQGLYFQGYSEEDANPDLGDSAISETCGLGAFCMGAAPAIVQFVGGTPAMALEETKRMFEITVGTNPSYSLPPLDFAGAPTGIDVRKVVATGITPVINTGIAHKEPDHGLVGAGLAWVPMECFTRALDAIADVFEREAEEQQ